MNTPTGSLSDRGVLRAARELRAVSWLLEGGVYVLLAGTVLALGGVRPWTYVSAWFLTIALGGLLWLRARLVAQLRRRIGAREFAFHPSGLWIVLDEPTPYGQPVWSFDLARPRLPRASLAAPLLMLLLWIGCQLVPLPETLLALLTAGREGASTGATGAWRPLSLSPRDTLRGAAFVASLLLAHLAAAAAFERVMARRRLRLGLVVLGVGVALLALLQMALGTRRIWFVYAPRENDGGLTLFGPFANRNHFAAWMAMVACVALGLAADALRRYRRRVGSRANLRRALVALQAPEGSRALYTLVGALVCVASLVAANSRGGLVAFLAALALAASSAARRRARLLWLPAGLVLLAVSWFGLPRLGARFGRTALEAPGRTLVWKDTLRRMPGHWLAGSGFNTFAASMSRVTLWSLPRGATPLSPPYETTLASAPRLGYLSHLGTPRLTWYREAHNDYLQVLVETGVPGLLLALLAAGAALRGVRHDPWLLAALGAVLLHALVDFPFQILAIAALFVTLAALRPQPRRPEPEPAEA